MRRTRLPKPKPIAHNMPVPGNLTAHRVLRPIPTDLFNYKNKQFTTFASDLKGYTFGSYITLVNPKTGGTVTFELVQVKRDMDQDVQFWRYTSTNGLTIVVFNT